MIIFNQSFALSNSSRPTFRQNSQTRVELGLIFDSMIKFHYELNAEAPNLPELDIKVFFSSYGSEWTALSKRWKIFPLFKPCRFHENTISITGSLWKSSWYYKNFPKKWYTLCCLHILKFQTTFKKFLAPSKTLIKFSELTPSVFVPDLAQRAREPLDCSGTWVLKNEK